MKKKKDVVDECIIYKDLNKNLYYILKILVSQLFLYINKSFLIVLSSKNRDWMLLYKEWWVVFLIYSDDWYTV